jgi:polyhydroxyalkanoate synthase
MAEPQPAKAIDPQELQQALARIAERSATVAAKFLESQPHVDMARNIGDLGIDKAFADLGARLLSDPARLAQLHMRAWEDFLKLWTTTLTRAQGGTAPAVREPARGDNRFRSELWQNNFVFDYIKQSYLIAAEHIQRVVAETGGLDEASARKVKFFTRQYIDALSPTNFALTNPDVLKATADSGGRNLLNGLNNLLTDLERGRGKLSIRMTDYDAFRLGDNVAATPGKVVFQNDLMQLLQYTPTTAEAHRAPLVICPPWINKYYILDLRPSNSFIKWAVDQGHTVFVISWVNPDETLTHKTFDDYLFEGPLAAMEAARQATGEASVNLIGYCLGGTLTACLMAWLEARGQADRVKSVTYFTTMIDFTDPGELGVFVDEPTVDRLEKRMAARGYLEGEEMAGTFNLLRDNDLIWSFVVNNYLMGKEPFPFDLLYWNSDATRMPAKMHTFYLRNMYIRNLLTRHGELQVGGEPMDLATVTTPTYFISTMEDHIAPWRSTYAGARLFSGPVRFVLGGSGHIAGIVNPPAANKYCYWTNKAMPEAAPDWLTSADRHEGSWWNDWNTWISAFSGGKVPARTPGDRALRVIEDAPGAFAKVRLDGAGKAAAERTRNTTPAPTSAASSTTPADDAPAPRKTAAAARTASSDAVSTAPAAPAGSAADKPAARRRATRKPAATVAAPAPARAPSGGATTTAARVTPPGPATTPRVPARRKAGATGSVAKAAPAPARPKPAPQAASGATAAITRKPRAAGAAAVTAPAKAGSTARTKSGTARPATTRTPTAASPTIGKSAATPASLPDRTVSKPAAVPGKNPAPATTVPSGAAGMISELFRQQGKPGSPRPSQTATAPAPALAKGTAKARKVKRK